MGKRSLSSSALSQPAPDVVARVHFSLLQWYQEHQRDLPWRATDNAYAILVSEIMLQQTQVDRVLPKYRQFLTAFPTLADLAAAPTADVISVWVPLGYNSRAVRLQSAGAIACFAYRKQVATVDTNIYRVLRRIFLGLEHPEAQINNDQMLRLAESVMPAGESYNWNQALMDLGATICTSANPQCVRCPLQETCAAYTEMSQYSLFPGGTVLRQLRKVAEKKAPYQAQPFTTLSPGQRMTLAALGLIIKPEFHDDDLPWLQKLVSGLAKDGLVDVHEDGVRLP